VREGVGGKKHDEGVKGELLVQTGETGKNQKKAFAPHRNVTEGGR